MAEKHNQGKKNRKLGRSGRSPAHQRYTNERRWARHKAAHILRFMRRHPNYHVPTNASEDVKMFVYGRKRETPPTTKAA